MVLREPSSSSIILYIKKVSCFLNFFKEFVGLFSEI